MFREGIGRVFEIRAKKLESQKDDLSEYFQQPSSITSNTDSV